MAEESFHQLDNPVIERLGDPEALEALYRQSTAAFPNWLAAAQIAEPGSETLKVWRARLNYQAGPATASHVASVSVWLVVLLALMSGLLEKLAAAIDQNPDEFGSRFLFVFLFGPVAAYFALADRARDQALPLLGFLLVSINLLSLPMDRPAADSVVMAWLHTPLVAVSLIGLTFMGNAWRKHNARLEYLHYLGEVVAYSGIVLLGGVVMSLLTMALLAAIGLWSTDWYFNYVVVMGLMATPVIATYIFDGLLARQSRIAHILANVFSPLFLLTVVGYLLAVAYRGANPFVDRDFLISFNGLLLIVLGITVYSVAGRQATERIRFLDYINLGLVTCTLVIDAIALSAILFRLLEQGLTPNRVAVTGANLLIFIHLVLILRAYTGVLWDISHRPGLATTVTNYLPLYSMWSALIFLGLPPMFAYQ